jgi:hypothetical protein
MADLTFLNLDTVLCATPDEIAVLLDQIPNAVSDWWEANNIAHAIINASDGATGEDQRLLFLFWARKNPCFSEPAAEEIWRKVARQRRRILVADLNYLEARAAGAPPLGKIIGQDLSGHPALNWFKSAS